MDNRYTEGIAFDGAAILYNGKPITIDEILKRLNNGKGYTSEDMENNYNKGFHDGCEHARPAF